MEYSQYKKLQEQVEGRVKTLSNSASEAADAGFENAKAFADSAEEKFDHVASEVQAKGQDEYEKAANLYQTKKPFKYIVIAGVVVLVVAVVAGVFFGG